MVRDEVLRALGDPREIADAQLAAIPEGGRQGEPRRVCERARSARQMRGLFHPKPVSAKLLRARKVEAEEIAPFVAHAVILTVVDMYLSVLGLSRDG
jgi:hypothetical protein